MIEASRFIFKPEFVQDGHVEKEAFMPPPDPTPPETSVIMHTGLPIEWETGYTIGSLRRKPLRLCGSAEFTEFDALMADLHLVPEPSKISANHANLKGWDEMDQLRKIWQADVIASQSRFVPSPNREIDNSRGVGRVISQ